MTDECEWVVVVGIELVRVTDGSEWVVVVGMELV